MFKVETNKLTKIVNHISKEKRISETQRSTIRKIFLYGCSL